MSVAGPEPLAAENARLKRRLERERATRQQVELIAENGMRDLYTKQRQLGFLERIATTANRSGSMLSVLAEVLQEICRFTGWGVGHAYMLDGHGAERRMWPTKVWHVAPRVEISTFRSRTERQPYGLGEGIPGQVWSNAAPLWVPDIAVASNFPRREEALRCGLRAALALPLLIEAEVVAVLELFTDRVIAPDLGLLQLMAQAGTQLGRVIERDRAADRLHDALHDPLTGLPNRPNFLHRLEQALADCALGRRPPFCILVLNLDRFKIVNDSLGPALGDALLAAVATRLGEALGATDAPMLAHLGADEFAVLLPATDTAQQAVAIADRVHRALQEPFAVSGHEMLATTSIGVDFGVPHAASALELLRNADLAMHHAKQRGAGRTAFYHAAMHTRALQRIAIETDLRAAVKAQEFVLHYQPIVSLATEQVVGFEALVRWQLPNGVLRPPADFIGVAEETGLIVPIGMLVLREACRRLGDWNRRFPGRFPGATPLTMSVNLSPRQFVQADLTEQIARVVADAAIDPATLRLEITEAVTMDDAERTVQVMTALRAQGVRISIDDFGTGYSCLSYLHRFPLQLLKIDRSFVSRMESSAESLHIVRTLLSLARNLGMEVVAEGAETAAEVARLKSLACDYCQGFFYARPLPAAAVESLLQSGGSLAAQAGPAYRAIASISQDQASSSAAPAVLSIALAR